MIHWKYTLLLHFVHDKDNSHIHKYRYKSIKLFKEWFILSLLPSTKKTLRISNNNPKNLLSFSNYPTFKFSPIIFLQLLRLTKNNKSKIK